MIRTPALVALLACLLVALAPPIPVTAEERRPLVVATIPPLASIAREVCRGLAEVHYIVPPGSDPHQYALSPSDVDLVRRSDLLVAVGKEPFIGDLVSAAGGLVLSWDDWVRAGLVIRGGNPHYLWLYPENAVKVAELVYEKLAYIDPAHADAYRANLEEFKAEVEELVEWIDRYVVVYGVKGTPVLLVGSHHEPLVEAMGLRIVGPLIRGEERAPGPGDVSRVEEEARRLGAAVVVALASQRYGDEGRLAETLSRDLGIPVVYVYGVMVSPDDSYVEFIKYTVSSIVAGIEASRSEARGSPSTPLSASTIAVVVSSLLAVIAVETYLLVRWR